MASSQSIGKSGQKAFSLLCSDAGLICNASLEDEAGWDFFVQLALDDKFKGPLDQRPAPLSAFVQVKASHSIIVSIEVKLSNAERMITEPKPSFFAVGERVGAAKDFSFRLGHVGESAASFILKALREATYKKVKFTNRKKIYIPLDLLELTTIEKPEDIVLAIRKHSAGSINDYIFRKNQILKTTGYGPQPFVGSFSTTEKTESRSLISLMIGEVDEIEVSSIKVDETRFDITLPKIQFDMASMRIESLVTQTCEFVIESTVSKLKADFICQVRAPVIPNLPSDLFRIRLSNDQFAFSINPDLSVSNWIYNPNFDTIKKWQEIREDFTLLVILASGGGDFYCYKEGECFAHGEVATSNPMEDEIRKYVTIINAVNKLSESRKFKAKAAFSINELIDFSHRSNLITSVLAEQNLDNLFIDAKVNLLSTEESASAVFVFPLFFRCSNRIMAVAVAIEGAAEIDQASIRLHPAKISAEECDLFDSKSECIDFLHNFSKSYSENNSDKLLVFHPQIHPNGEKLSETHSSD